MSKQQQQRQQTDGMKSNKLLLARWSSKQHCHDRSSNQTSSDDGANATSRASPVLESNKRTSTISSSSSSWRLSSSSTGYFSLALILAAAMKFSFMAGQYFTGSSSLDRVIHFVPEPLLSSVMMLMQQPFLTTIIRRESLPVFSNQERFTPTQEATGRQVVVTIENVNEDFLSSEDALTNAMMRLVQDVLLQQQHQLVLLSHHCHYSKKSNNNSIVAVRCVGILPNGHILIHAWPLQNQVRVDFFFTSSRSDSSNSQRLRDESSIILAAIFKTFAMTMPHQTGAAPPPRLHSSVKRRGFWEPAEQRVNLVDVGAYDTTYVLKASSSETSLHTSVQQQRQEEEDDDDIIYHEALVHPAMLVHPNPRRVAVMIDSSGERSSSSSISATVRQVLKHNTVETVVVFGWQKNESSLVLDDARVVIVKHKDASSWFIDRFSDEEDDDGDKEDDDEEEEEALFDVVIIGSSSTADSSFSSPFGKNAETMDAMHSALSKQGVLVADVGVADRLGDAGWNYRRNNNVHERLDMIQALQDAEFHSVKTYTERRSSSSRRKSSELRMLHIAFCDFDSKARWYMNQAEIDLELNRRMLVSSNDSTRNSQLSTLDGATIMSYQYPTRIVEEVYCRQVPTPEMCLSGHGYDPQAPNVPLTALEVKPSGIHGAGRGVFFKEDFAKGAYLSIDSGVHGMNVMPFTFALIEKMEKNNNGGDNATSIGITGAGDLWSPLESYVDGYGFEHLFYGKAASAVDPGIVTFVNHGCNGTNNVGSVLNVTEMNADINVIPMDLSDSDAYDDEFYSPFADRNHWTYVFTQDKLKVDVKAGMEVLDNYLFFYADWAEGVVSLRSECQGIVTGTVVDYEREAQGTMEHL